MAEIKVLVVANNKDLIISVADKVGKEDSEVYKDYLARVVKVDKEDLEAYKDCLVKVLVAASKGLEDLAVSEVNKGEDKGSEVLEVSVVSAKVSVVNKAMEEAKVAKDLMDSDS